MRLALCLIPLALLTAGCGRAEDGPTVTINAGDGATLGAKDGTVTIDTPVFKGSLALPKLDLTAENFDINGVHLYPGTRIGNVNVDASGGDGVVNLTFDSPAPVATVREWLRREFEKAGTQVTVEGDALRGTTEDKAFRIDLQPAGDRAAGKVTIS